MRTQHQHPFWLNPLYTTVDFSGIISGTLATKHVANDYSAHLKHLIDSTLYGTPMPAKKTYLPANWCVHDIQAFTNMADKAGYSSIGTAVLIAHETGQPYENILELQQPRDYNNGIFTCHGKDGKKLFALPVSSLLRARLTLLPRTQLLLCPCEDTAIRWDSVVFLHIFQSIAQIAGLSLKATQIKT